jgi:hypothetical protein
VKLFAETVRSLKRTLSGTSIVLDPSLGHQGDRVVNLAQRPLRGGEVKFGKRSWRCKNIRVTGGKVGPAPDCRAVALTDFDIEILS